MKHSVQNIAVLGGGSWGTALAMQIARANIPVCMWDIDAEHVQQMQQVGSNEKYLPGLAFPPSLTVSDSLQNTIQQSHTLLLVVPSHAMRSFLLSAKPFIQKDHRIVWATKGLEEGTGKLMHQILAEVLPECSYTAVISGPTFAREVAQGLPTAMTAAASSLSMADEVVAFLHHENFRVYTCEDIIGVELGGALKNVLAIAAGVADGLGFGANTRAALITRGLNEMMSVGHAMGARQETFMGLAGMGDLILTCTDNQSRNRQMGLKLAQGLTVEQAREEIGQAVEGVKTAKEAWKLVQEYKLDCPIIEQAYKVLYEKKPAKEAMLSLLARKAKVESQ